MIYRVNGENHIQNSKFKIQNSKFKPNSEGDKSTKVSDGIAQLKLDKKSKAFSEEISKDSVTREPSLYR